MSNTNIDNKDLEKLGEFVRENKGRGNIAGLTACDEFGIPLDGNHCPGAFYPVSCEDAHDVAAALFKPSEEMISSEIVKTIEIPEVVSDRGIVIPTATYSLRKLGDDELKENILSMNQAITKGLEPKEEKTIEDKNVLNVQDALQNVSGVIAASSTNSPSPKLIIRGAGLKASYGVREIMVMKDGVPMTDPDSFTRFDFIDMQDVSSIEVQKGPGSINAVNSTGGVIQLITKSVFAEDKNSVKVGIGDDGQKNFNTKLRGKISDSDFASFTFSKRELDNSWRDNNEFDTTQATLKYGHIFKDNSTIENEISYTESNLNLPASMTKTEFNTFKQTGEQHNTSSTWQNSAGIQKLLHLILSMKKKQETLLINQEFILLIGSIFIL